MQLSKGLCNFQLLTAEEDGPAYGGFQVEFSLSFKRSA